MTSFFPAFFSLSISIVFTDKYRREWNRNGSNIKSESHVNSSFTHISLLSVSLWSLFDYTREEKTRENVRIHFFWVKPLETIDTFSLSLFLRFRRRCSLPSRTTMSSRKDRKDRKDRKEWNPMKGRKRSLEGNQELKVFLREDLLYQCFFFVAIQFT